MFRRTNSALLATVGILGIFVLIGRHLERHAQLQRPKAAETEVSAHRAPTLVADAANNKAKDADGMSNELYAKVDARMKERRRAMRAACSKYNLNQSLSAEEIYVKNPFLKTSLFYSDKYKLLLCQIPKCASTNQAKFLVTIEGFITVEESNKMNGARATSLAEKKLSARRVTNINEISKRIGTYRKLVLAREPFSRLLSAFRNKLYNNTRGDGYAGMAQRLHEEFGGEVAKTKVVKGVAPEVTLDDFIRHLIEPKRNAQHDQHWNFFNRLCAPCLMDYDFIGHMETLDDDISYVKKELGIEGIPFPASYDSFTDWEKVKKYFSSASPSLVNALYHTYKMDYDIFGYPPPPQF